MTTSAVTEKKIHMQMCPALLVTLVLCCGPVLGQIYITEVLAHTDPPEVDWVELFNPSLFVTTYNLTPQPQPLLTSLGGL